MYFLLTFYRWILTQSVLFTWNDRVPSIVPLSSLSLGYRLSEGSQNVPDSLTFIMITVPIIIHGSLRDNACYVCVPTESTNEETFFYYSYLSLPKGIFLILSRRVVLFNIRSLSFSLSFRSVFQIKYNKMWRDSFFLRYVSNYLVTMS